MPPRRPPPKGLPAGEKLKREKLAGNDLAWGWVGTEVTDASQITKEHCLRAYGFSGKSPRPPCLNKYVQPKKKKDTDKSKVVNGKKTEKATGELPDDVIVISDDDEGQLKCTKKACKDNVNCLNYLGQEKWEDEDEAWEAFREIAKLGYNPSLDTRDPSVPVGLRNLGATCYANAFLQVWFRDLAFRTGVYRCSPAEGAESRFEESPLFHLQSTFAALQAGAENVFNPVKLVESLQLRTSEQQDAQEFSKLFMNHLDSEFKKQADPSVKTLIEDQFQGKLAYGTLCRNCMNRSEREEDFLEVEINLEKNTTLEDRIAALLQPEALTDDNKYLCGRCESLQDATRYTVLREFPPVLHFSLLRFVFDFETMERKKSKQAILFPLTLDMDHFLIRPNAPNSTSASEPKRKNVYALRGILQHKGSSAYHGHYEAQIKDIATGKWFEFNDEEVRVIKPNVKNGKGEANEKNGVKPRPVTVARRKRTIDDSDIEEISPPAKKPHLELEKEENKRPKSENGYLSSKDAYMLIYVRQDVDNQEDGTVRSTDPQSSSQCVEDAVMPPPRAMEAVDKLRTAHEELCEAYNIKEKEVRERFERTRRQVMDVYRSWDSLSADGETTAIAARNGLQDWLTRRLIKPPKPKKAKEVEDEETKHAEKTDEKSDEKPEDNAAGTSEPLPDQVKTEDGSIPVDESSSDSSNVPLDIVDNTLIMCSHGKLDPEKTGEMRKLSLRACEKMSADGCTFRPRIFTLQDVCPDCIHDICAEKLYKMDHPKAAKLLTDLVDEGLNEPAFWISKAWLKDWCSAQPRMHRAGCPDPPPDAEGYREDVICEHDGLTDGYTNKRSIPVQAAEYLHALFPTWTPVSYEEETCAVCETQAHVHREDGKESRKRAEEEKAKLKKFLGNSVNAIESGGPCAIVPSAFMQTWRAWVFQPTVKPRPSNVDTGQFFCEHGLLAIDPNSSVDISKKATFIPADTWDILQDFYSCGPVIGVIGKGTVGDGSERIESELEICEDCRRQRRSVWQTTELTVRLLRPGNPVPTPETWMKGDSGNGENVTNGRESGGPRKSKRLRESKAVRSRLTVEKSTTVKEMKLMLQKNLDIVTIAQRLFYHGCELEDNSATVESLGVLANDCLDLLQEGEDLTILNSDDEDSRTKKKVRRDEGRAFGGTLLGASSPQRRVSSPPEEPPPPEPLSSAASSQTLVGAKACLQCTFENPLDVAMCTMCDTAF